MDRSDCEMTMMTPWKLMIVGTVTALSACAGGAPETGPLDGPNDAFLVDGRADAYGVAEGSALAEGTLRLVNTGSRELFELEVSIYGPPLDNLLAHRDGPDGMLGTADDDLIDTLTELDAIPHIGPRTFRRLVDYANLNGYVDHAADAHQVFGGMIEPRRHFASVQLPDGRIFVTGGTGEEGRLSSSEVFDPATQNWSPASPMNAPRAHATATSMTDGRILIAGGYDSGDAKATTEIWDPATDTWAAGPTLVNRRMHHTATALDDGRVLVVGGQNSPRTYTEPAAEVLDPTAQSWTEVGDTPVGVQEHTATRLPDGSVLIAGGYNRFEKDRTRTLVLFDPTTDELKVVGRMHTARSNHTATIVGGQLLIAGGVGNRHDPLDAAELIDLATFDATPLPPMLKARTDHRAVTLPSGAVALLGGEDESFRNGIVEVDTFDPLTQSWTFGAPLYAGHQGFHVHAMGSEPLLVGGEVMNQLNSPTVLYREGQTTPAIRPETEVDLDWEFLENFGERVSCKAGHVEYMEAIGKLFCFPGREAENEPIGTYVWGDSGWEEIVAPLDSPLPPRTGHTMTYDAARGRIVLFGGQKRWQYNLDDTWEFDGTSWTKVAPGTAAIPPRQWDGQLVFDSARDRSVLLPGRMDGTRQTTLYAWDGVNWEVVDSPNNEEVFKSDPYEQRNGYGAAYDAGRDRIVVFGGWANSRPTPTYEFDGSQWYRIGTGGPAHGARVDATYDPVAGVVYAVGVSERSRHYVSGIDIFAYDGSWRRLSVGDGFRTTNWNKALVYDGSTGYVTLATGSLQQLREHVTPNQRPSIGYLGGRTAYANEELSLTLEVGDPDGHDVTVSTSMLPAGATFDTSTHTFSWTPEPTQGGEYAIDFTVSDGALTRTTTLEITVEGLITYGPIPQGPIDMVGGVTMSGTVRERDRWGWRSSGASFRLSCHFVGHNPGRVTYTCEMVKTSQWPYDYTTHVSGQVHPDGTMSGMNAEIVALQWDDYELVVRSVGGDWQDEEWTARGEYRGYLTPQ